MAIAERDAFLDRKLSMIEFCNLLRQDGVSVHFNTIRYWIEVGLKSKANEDDRIKLQSTYVGATLSTCLRWYDEFEAAMKADRRNGQ